MLLRFIFLTNFCSLLLPAQSFLQNYTGHSGGDNSFDVYSGSSSVRLTWYAEGIVRVDYFPERNSQSDSSFVIVQQPLNKVPYTIQESDSSVSVRYSGVQIKFRKYPLRISFIDSAGNTLLSEPANGGLSVHEKERTLRFAMDHDDHFYGTGERGTSLDKRGQRFLSYNTQVGGYSEPLGTMNLNVPFFVTSSGYALYVDNTYRGTFDFGFSDSTVYSYTAEGGELSYYFIAAKTIPEQLKKYTWLTGRQPLPPRWIFGFTQSKNRYVNETELRGIVRTMRQKEFPCDAIVLDLAWFKHMGDISWDESAWPDHKTMIADFLNDGIKTILITEPYIIQPSLNFSEADRSGFLAKDSSGKTHLLEKWWSCNGCNSSLLDMTNPKAREWWWEKHPKAFGTDIAGIWTDLGEPERHPESMEHFLGSTVKIHNIYNLLWAQTIFEGFNKLNPNERVVNLTRSGFAGIQRYGVLPWSGDVARNFGGLSVQLPMLLNMGMSGIAYHNSDIGGYSRIPTTPELYIRWMQYGVFCPVSRTHGAGEIVKGSPTEPWRFGSEAERICRDFIRLRYKLLPYNYTLAYHNFHSGLPLARPLMWLDPEDLNLMNESSSYMWGDAFLISPVVTAGQNTKEVYLPKGKWIHFWDDSIVYGGTAMKVRTPLDQMPIFVKAGSIIPTAPVMKFSEERSLDTLTMLMYPDTDQHSKASYILYEDDGKSLGYRSGEYSLTEFSMEYTGSANDRSFHVAINPSNGTFKGKSTERNMVLEIHNFIGNPAGVHMNGIQCRRRNTYETFRSSDISYYYDQKLLRLFVQYRNRTDIPVEIHITGISPDRTMR